MRIKMMPNVVKKLSSRVWLKRNSHNVWNAESGGKNSKAIRFQETPQNIILPTAALVTAGGRQCWIFHPGVASLSDSSRSHRDSFHLSLELLPRRKPDGWQDGKLSNEEVAEKNHCHGWYDGWFCEASRLEAAVVALHHLQSSSWIS